MALFTHIVFGAPTGWKGKGPLLLLHWSDNSHIAPVNVCQCQVATVVNAPVVLTHSQCICQPGNEVCFMVLGLGWQSML